MESDEKLGPAERGDTEEGQVQAAYRRVAARIRDAIDAGDLPPGKELPTSKELAKKEGITQETALKALRYLAAEGYIDLIPRKQARVRRRPRARVVVRDRHAYRDGIGYYFDRGAQEWRAVGTPRRGLAVPPPHVADQLGIARDEDVIVRHRELGPPGAAQAKQIAKSYIPLTVAAEIPRLRAEHTGRGGIYDRIEEHFNEPLQWEEEAWSRPSTDEEKATLGLPPSVWALVITRKSWVERGGARLIVEVNETSMSAEEFAVSYQVTRDATAAWPHQERPAG